MPAPQRRNVVLNGVVLLVMVAAVATVVGEDEYRFDVAVVMM